MDIRRLVEADVPACVALAADRRWVADARKWRLLLRTGELYGIDDRDGGLAGTVLLARYGGDLVAIGMLLVATRRERQGLGRRLMDHALSRAGDATVFLTATDHGRPLYERLDFRAVGTVTTHVGRFTGDAAGISRAARPADRSAIQALDAAAFGADRGAVLGPHLDIAEHLRVVERDREIAAYAAVLPNADHPTIGPVIGGGEDLLSDVAAQVDGSVRLDLYDNDLRLRAWASDHGLAHRGNVTLMVHRDRSLSGDRARIVAPIALALG